MQLSSHICCRLRGVIEHKHPSLLAYEALYRKSLRITKRCNFSTLLNTCGRHRVGQNLLTWIDFSFILHTSYMNFLHQGLYYGLMKPNGSGNHWVSISFRGSEMFRLCVCTFDYLCSCCLSLLLLSFLFVNEQQQQQQQQPGASSLMMCEACAFLPVTDSVG